MKPGGLSVRDFLGLAENSFAFYSTMPSDHVALNESWPKVDLSEIAQKILSAEHIGHISEADIDQLSCGLLVNDTAPLPGKINWANVADRLSILYTMQFRAEGSRSLKMKSARANFFLRDTIDFNAAPSTCLVQRRSLDNPYPWDWLPCSNGELILDSGSSSNVHYRSFSGPDFHFQLGLPTQVDVLEPDRFAISSCYSNGWYDWSVDAEPIYRTHARPVLIGFRYSGETYFLDAAGYLFSLENKKALLQLPVENAWRARLIDNTLFIFSLAEPSSITVLNMKNLHVSKRCTSPVLVGNDICKFASTFYMIDKMQGKVFSFDEAFRPTGERLSFGKGEHSLCDPVALKTHQDKLWILSWLTGSLTQISPF